MNPINAAYLRQLEIQAKTLSDSLEKAHSENAELRDCLSDCVNALSNYRLLQIRVKDPVGAKVTYEEIHRIIKLLKKEIKVVAVVNDIRAVDGKTYKCLAIAGNAALWMKAESEGKRYIVNSSQCCQPGASNETWAARFDDYTEAADALRYYSDKNLFGG